MRVGIGVVDDNLLWDVLYDPLTTRIDSYKTIFLCDRIGNTRPGRLSVFPTILSNSSSESLSRIYPIPGITTGHLHFYMTLVVVSCETLAEYKLVKPHLQSRIADLRVLSGTCPFPDAPPAVFIIYLPLGTQTMASGSSKVYKKILDKLTGEFGSTHVYVHKIQLFDVVAGTGVEQEWTTLISAMKQCVSTQVVARTRTYEDAVRDSTGIDIRDSFAMMYKQVGLYEQALALYDECDAILGSETSLVNPFANHESGSSYVFYQQVSLCLLIQDYTGFVLRSKKYLTTQWKNVAMAKVSVPDRLQWLLSTLYSMLDMLLPSEVCTRVHSTTGEILEFVLDILWEAGTAYGLLNSEASTIDSIVTLSQTDFRDTLTPSIFPFRFISLSKVCISEYKSGSRTRCVVLVEQRLAQVYYNLGRYEDALVLHRQHSSNEWNVIRYQGYVGCSVCEYALCEYSDYARSYIMLLRFGEVSYELRDIHATTLPLDLLAEVTVSPKHITLDSLAKIDIPVLVNGVSMVLRGTGKTRIPLELPVSVIEVGIGPITLTHSFPSPVSVILDSITVSTSSPMVTAIPNNLVLEIFANETQSLVITQHNLTFSSPSSVIDDITGELRIPVDSSTTLSIPFVCMEDVCTFTATLLDLQDVVTCSITRSLPCTRPVSLGSVSNISNTILTLYLQSLLPSTTINSISLPGFEFKSSVPITVSDTTALLFTGTLVEDDALTIEVDIKGLLHPISIGIIVPAPQFRVVPTATLKAVTLEIEAEAVTVGQAIGITFEVSMPEYTGDKLFTLVPGSDWGITGKSRQVLPHTEPICINVLITPLQCGELFPPSIRIDEQWIYPHNKILVLPKEIQHSYMTVSSSPGQ